MLVHCFFIYSNCERQESIATLLPITGPNGSGDGRGTPVPQENVS